MENNNSKLLASFIAGIAIGAAVGYFLATDKKEEIIDGLKNSASKFKDDLKGAFDKGKQMVDDLSKDADDVMGI